MPLSSTSMNFNDAVPAPPSGKVNVKWQGVTPEPTLVNITAVANAGGLFQITVDAATVLLTNDAVTIVSDFTAIVGRWRVTVVNSTNFTLQGSAYSAGWALGTDPETVLPARDVSAWMPIMVGDSGSGGISGAVPAPGAGDAAAGKYLKADGTFQVPGGGVGGNSVYGEIPTGAMDGVNLTFTLAHAPNPALSLRLYLNGVYQHPDPASEDYGLSGVTITMTVAPVGSDYRMRAFYVY